MNDLISVIIPIYNVEAYLHRCVDSILRQTYQNLEIILVNDGSPDRCGEICDAYALKDNRVNVVHKVNGGLSDARNEGINIARGKFISFIDSDDWVNDDYIEKLYNLLIMTQSEISVCNFYATSNENVEYDQSKIAEILQFTNIEALSQFNNKYSEQLVVAWGKLYKKTLFDNLRYPVGRIHEDEFITYKLIHKSQGVVLTTEPLLYYWQRENSITGNSFNLNNRLDAIDAIQEKAEFFENIMEMELRDKTYRTLFGLYKNTLDQIDVLNNFEQKVALSLQFQDLKNKLRKTNQSLAFRVYFEVYYWMPKTVTKIHKIYSGLRCQKVRLPLGKY